MTSRIVVSFIVRVVFLVDEHSYLVIFFVLSYFHNGSQYQENDDYRNHNYDYQHHRISFHDWWSCTHPVVEFKMSLLILVWIGYQESTKRSIEGVSLALLQSSIFVDNRCFRIHFGLATVEINVSLVYFLNHNI